MPFLIVAGLLYARAAEAPEVLCNLVTDYGIAIGPQDQTAGKPGTSSASYIATQTKPILHSYLTNALRFQPFKKKNAIYRNSCRHHGLQAASLGDRCLRTGGCSFPCIQCLQQNNVPYARERRR